MTKIGIQAQFCLTLVSEINGKTCIGERNRCIAAVFSPLKSLNGEAIIFVGVAKSRLRMVVDILQGILDVIAGRPFEPGDLVGGEVALVFGRGADPEGVGRDDRFLR